MAAQNVKLAYGTASQGITITLASLAQAAARESTAIDNSSNLFLDAMIYLSMTVANTSPGSDKRINIWFYGSEDGTNYGDNATGADATLTMRSFPNLAGPFVVNVPTQNIAYKAFIPSVAEFFGGVLPVKWGIVVENRTNIAFDGTEGTFVKEYRGVFQTIG